jgi:head-tail adaptor
MKCGGGCSTHGRYHYRVVIQEPSGEPDATGHVDLTDPANWKQYTAIRVNFITKGGREGRMFDQIQSQVNLLAHTRSTKQTRGIHPDMRLIHDGRTFNISAAYDVNESKDVVQLELIEVV